MYALDGRVSRRRGSSRLLQSWIPWNNTWIDRSSSYAHDPRDRSRRRSRNSITRREVCQAPGVPNRDGRTSRTFRTRRPASPVAVTRRPAASGTTMSSAAVPRENHTKISTAIPWTITPARSCEIANRTTGECPKRGNRPAAVEYRRGSAGLPFAVRGTRSKCGPGG